MFNIFKLNLQLFAGEGAGDGGGEGAATTGEAGVPAVDPEQRLRDLGIPEEKLAKHRSARMKRLPKQVPAAQPAVQESPAEPAQKQSAPAEEKPTEEGQKAPERMSFKDILKDPEYSREINAMVRDRLKTAKPAEENMNKLAPALEVLARKYGQDPANMDYEALATAISNDDSYYEERAMEMGVSVDVARQLDQQKRQIDRQNQVEEERRQQEAETLEMTAFRQHMSGLEQQGEVLKKTFPSFDLRKELQDKRFARMVAPGVGMSVEDAYYAVHRAEIQAASMKAAQQQTAQKIANDIQAGNRRPQENGTSSQAASTTTFDYRKASKEEREALKARIRQAKMEGRILYPGQ